MMMRREDFSLVAVKWCYKRAVVYNALWIKSGNRGNLKCWKENDHIALIVHRKNFISFLSDAKLQKLYNWFLGWTV